jgi:hypothetical protein
VSGCAASIISHTEGFVCARACLAYASQYAVANSRLWVISNLGCACAREAQEQERARDIFFITTR